MGLVILGRRRQVLLLRMRTRTSESPGLRLLLCRLNLKLLAPPTAQALCLLHRNRRLLYLRPMAMRAGKQQWTGLC